MFIVVDKFLNQGLFAAEAFLLVNLSCNWLPCAGARAGAVIRGFVRPGFN